MPLPTTFPDFRFYPGDDTTEVLRSLQRMFQSMVINKILYLPEDYTNFGNEIIAVNQDQNSPVPASQVGEGGLSFAYQKVKAYKPFDVTVSASESLRDRDHLGSLIVMSNPSSASLTISLNADPALGVSNFFECRVLRLIGSSAVEIIPGSGMTIRNVDGHTKVAEGGIISILVVGTDIYTHGYGE